MTGGFDYRFLFAGLAILMAGLAVLLLARARRNGASQT
jgi:hypothetical protein